MKQIPRLGRLLLSLGFILNFPVVYMVSATWGTGVLLPQKATSTLAGALCNTACGQNQNGFY